MISKFLSPISHIYSSMNRTYSSITSNYQKSFASNSNRFGLSLSSQSSQSTLVDFTYGGYVEFSQKFSCILIHHYFIIFILF